MQRSKIRFTCLNERFSDLYLAQLKVWNPLGTYEFLCKKNQIKNDEIARNFSITWDKPWMCLVKVYNSTCVTNMHIWRQ